MARIVIGLTGAFGSGCTFLADNFFQNKLNFKKYSLSAALKNEFLNKKGKSHENRHELQDFGNELREVESSAIAKLVYNEIEKDNLDKDINIIIDSIRNPSEIDFFRKTYPEFVLFAIFADYDIRWERVKSEYNNSSDKFNIDESKDKGNNEPKFGQRISDCFFEADVIISNNSEINCVSPNDEYENMGMKIQNYIRAFTEPTKSNPTINETLMAMAYASGRRSKCEKRRVGAIIVDENKNIISSGFNSVPRGMKDCKGKHGGCFRDKHRQKLREEVAELIHGEKEEKEDIASKIVSKTKVLELCRALHAEENAILALVNKSTSESLSKATLYATTYPCNLCANKIAQTGIMQIVYFEPYPVIQAKEIFKEAGVEAIPFEGVTFRAFFKAFNFEV